MIQGIVSLKQNLFLLAVPVFFLSCAEGDPMDDAKVSFGTYNNQIEMGENSLPSIVSSFGPDVSLSRPMDVDVKVYLESSGTAIANEDFTFKNPVIIPKGSLSSSADLQFIDDKLDEPDEIGVLRISSVEPINTTIDTASTSFLIRDDDAADLQIGLLWGTGGNTGSDQIDMDLYLWRESAPGSGIFEVVTTMANRGPLGFEFVTVSGLDPDGVYGLSCVYYHGNTDNFTFRVIYTPVSSAILEGGKSALEFNPTYNVININKGTVSVREQVFTKEGFHFRNITPFVVPESGS